MLSNSNWVTKLSHLWQLMLFPGIASIDINVRITIQQSYAGKYHEVVAVILLQVCSTCNNAMATVSGTYSFVLL